MSELQSDYSDLKIKIDHLIHKLPRSEDLLTQDCYALKLEIRAAEEKLEFLQKMTTGDYARVRQILEEMKASGIQPNIVTYHTLLRHSNDYAQARSVFEEMKASGIQPTEMSYNLLMEKV